jgi:hypothetical protein
MSSSGSRWDELSSQNERIIQAGESACGPSDQVSLAARTQWSELASQGERLAGDADPLFRLASSRRGITAPRLVPGAA